MKILSQIAIVVVAALITLGAAIHQGRTANRWGLSGEMMEIAPVVTSLPRDIGRWHLESPEKMTAYEENTLQCAEYLKGAYVNRDTGETVMANLLLGPPGPTSVHRPEICFSAIDFPQESQRKSIVLRGGKEGEKTSESDTAWRVQFRNTKDISGGVVRVYYAWNDGTQWTASEDPRVAYGTRPYLFKIQVVSNLDESASADEDDPAKAFLMEFIPVFEQVIAQHSKQTDADK